LADVRNSSVSDTLIRNVNTEELNFRDTSTANLAASPNLTGNLKSNDPETEFVVLRKKVNQTQPNQSDDDSKSSKDDNNSVFIVQDS
jgi:hypothetical protein